MRITRILNAVNWRYAVGEIFLIATGVLIALAASDWQERQVARQSEIAILMELQSHLKDDLEDLERRRDNLTVIESHLESLIAHLDSSLPYGADLDPLFGAVYGYSGIRLNTGAYESLKAQGLYLISDKSLRAHLSSVYEELYQGMQGSVDSEKQTSLNVFRPYFLKHFRDMRFRLTATPVDYNFIVKDPEFVRQKLVDRGERVVMEATGANRDEARQAIERAAGSVKLAIVMVSRGVDVDEAKGLLVEAGGIVRKVVGDPPPVVSS